MDYSTPQTVALTAMEDSDAFFNAITRMTQTNDSQELRELCTYLYNYDMGNVLDIPLTYSKDMIVYNSEKISGYNFVGTPCFFDVTQLVPAA